MHIRKDDLVNVYSLYSYLSPTLGKHSHYIRGPNTHTHNTALTLTQVVHTYIYSTKTPTVQVTVNYPTSINSLSGSI